MTLRRGRTPRAVGSPLHRDLTPSPDPRRCWLYSEGRYIPAETLQLRYAWSVHEQDAKALKPGNYRNLTASARPWYVFLPQEHRSPDHQVGLLGVRLDGGTAPTGTPELWIRDEPWGFLRIPQADHEILALLRHGRRALLTFDGVALWQAFGFFQDAVKGVLHFELRRHAAINFITTGSLLFRFDLAFMFDSGLRDEVERMIRNIEERIAAEKWDAVAQSTGDACDRILLDALLKEQASGKQLSVYNRHTDPRSWNFADRIKEACKLNLIPPGSPQHCQIEMARAFVNLHHGGASQVRRLTLEPADAMGCYAALKNLIAFFS